MIRVKLNGELKALEKPLTLDKLMNLLELHHHHIAIAVNFNVIPRSEFKSKKVKDGDKIDIIQPAGGG